jgi:hypothetical protein
MSLVADNVNCLPRRRPLHYLLEDYLVLVDKALENQEIEMRQGLGLGFV